ncbi:MAG: hypothetical protein ABIO05_02320 [Ferruginibacter sp.]
MFTAEIKSAHQSSTNSSATLIGAGTTITGNIEATGDIRIDGSLKGKHHCPGKSNYWP